MKSHSVIELNMTESLLFSTSNREEDYGSSDDNRRFLLILWLLGLVTSYTLGGFIHILLVLAIIVILIRVIQGRRPIP